MNQISKITWGLSLVGAVAIGVFGMWLLGPKPKEPPPNQAPLISLEKMGYLTSIKVNYSDVIAFDLKNALAIPGMPWNLKLGSTDVLLVAKGDCTVATDLRLAKYESTNPDAHTLSLVLQAPKSILARVNHSPRAQGGSYLYSITETGLQWFIPGNKNEINAVNKAFEFTEKEIVKVCSRADVIADAKKNTEDVLTPTFQAVGWKVTFIWK